MRTGWCHDAMECPAARGTEHAVDLQQRGPILPHIAKAGRGQAIQSTGVKSVTVCSIACCCATRWTVSCNLLRRDWCKTKICVLEATFPGFLHAIYDTYLAQLDPKNGLASIGAGAAQQHAVLVEAVMGSQFRCKVMDYCTM